jgi:putative ABC transport system permease protein
MIGGILKISMGALWANKLRSGLTLLGIVVGFTSVMTIISALEGMMGAIESDLARLGPATFIVQKFGMITSDEEFFEALKRKSLTAQDGEMVRENCDLAEVVSNRSGSNASIKFGNTTLRDVYVAGYDFNIISIIDMEVELGRFHSYEDDLHRRRVAFIGDFIREELFAGLDPLGKTIRVSGQKYTVIGVAKKRGSMMGQNQDDFIVLPFSAHVKQFGEPGNRYSMFVKAVSVERLNDAQDQVRMVLRSSRHVPYNKPDDFGILTADNILEFLNSITQMFRLGLIGISSISIVVGGIVVMNIMMVSVTERTREIGIRKAVGAKQTHILLQFLIEALATTMLGGVIGIVAGFLIAKSLVGMIDMDISPSTLAIVTGLSISTGIGLIFGIYPAMKAARLDPIKALSYE